MVYSLERAFLGKQNCFFSILSQLHYHKQQARTPDLCECLTPKYYKQG